MSLFQSPLIFLRSSAHYHLGSGTSIFYDLAKFTVHTPNPHRTLSSAGNLRPAIFCNVPVYSWHVAKRPSFHLGLYRDLGSEFPLSSWSCLWVSCLLATKFAEISNLITHIGLRKLRPAGSRKRVIPQGYGFSLVSFPNYFFESLAWFAIALMTGSWIGEVPFSRVETF